MIPKTIQIAPYPYLILFWKWPQEKASTYTAHMYFSIFDSGLWMCRCDTHTYTDDPLVCHSVYSLTLDAFGSNAISWLPQNQSTPSWPTIYIISNEINTEKLLNRKWLKGFIMKVDTPVHCLNLYSLDSVILRMDIYYLRCVYF